jgi:hypothetical protein
MYVTLATEPARPDRPNEDFVATTLDNLVMLDGVGTAGTESGCIHGTPWFVQQLGTTLLAALTAQPGADLAGVLEEAIIAVRSRHAGTCDVDHPGTPSSTVILLQEHADQVNYLVLADSVLLLDTTDGLQVITDDREATFAALVRGDLDATTNGTPEHEAALANFMTRIQAYRNQPDGFWVAAATPEAARQAITGTVPAASVRRAAVLTDGATRLVDRFELLDWPDLLDILDTAGPVELIRRTREAEASDPHGRRWKRGKATDDATAAYCTAFARTPALLH